MVITLGARWRVRGSVAAVAAFLLIGVALVTEFAGVDETNLLFASVADTWVPLSPLATPLSVAVFAFAAVCAGIGVGLLGISRAERVREDQLRLDPLSRPPVRHPLRRWIAAAGVVSVLLLLPVLWTAPVAHSFREEVPVGSCQWPPIRVPSDAVWVDLPAGAILAYQWSSADGQPVGEVAAPTGPPVSSVVVVGDLFTNSSSGYSSLESNGSAVPFWACDFSSSSVSGANRTVLLSGTYYLTVL
jgi:hypothetical protein